MLIGVSDYQDPSFPQVPAAEKSLRGVQRMLVDEELGGWSNEQVTPISNPVDCRRVMSELRRLAQGTSGVLLLYFVGHGTVTMTGDLVLAVSDTVADEPDVTGLEYSKIRSALLGSPAKVKAVVLDCCYSGRAIDVLAGGRQDLADIADIRGTYTLTAADHLAHAGQADTCTAFTRELLGLIGTGVAGGPPVLTFAELYPHLRQRLIARNLPHPNQRGTDTADKCPVARNVSDKLSKTGHGRNAKDVSAARQEATYAPIPSTTVEQPPPPRASIPDVAQQPPKPVAPFTISWTGKDPLSTYTDSSGKGCLAGLAKVVLGVTAPGVFMPLLLHRIKFGTGQDNGWFAWFLLSSVFGLFAIGILLWLPRVTHRLRTSGWSLHIGPQGIVTTDTTGRREYHWNHVQGVTIAEISDGGFNLYQYTGLHAQFAIDAAHSAPSRPAGWPPSHPGKIAVRKSGLVPVCALGPMTAHQRAELKVVLKKYAGNLYHEAPTQPMSNLVSVGGGNILAVDQSGNLWRYSAPNYYDSERTRVGTGWSVMKRLVAVGNSAGDILAIDRSGNMYRYYGPNYYGSQRTQVGAGWDSMTQVTAAGDGSADILAVDGSGKLFRYYAPDYFGSQRKQIGFGWNAMNTIVGVSDISGSGSADILAVDGSGKLIRYYAPDYFGSQRKQIGFGWNAMTNLVAIPGIGTTDLLATNATTKIMYRYSGPTYSGTQRKQISTGW
ncbi:caspase, EACC1-associated type [Streptomyces celluloflavus]|uniref:caspase, EACC1-associated type n=1 Tax=Streptomyces celluloflavus TaxID=58344 RepID=UPI0034613A33|nr:tachylectin-related carbohydrate-binding protein [Streptomyces celluloflavus]